MGNREPLVKAGRVVDLDNVLKGQTAYVVRPDSNGTFVSIVHSGTFNESRAELPDVSKGPHKGALPTMTYHASTQPVDIFPDVFGLSGRWSGTFLVACSVAPVAGITFHDDRPQAERTAHPLSA